MSSGFGELDFYDLAVGPRVGAFAFDYSGMGNSYGQYSPRQPYRRVGTPPRPVTVNQLDAAQAFLAAVCFRDICFADGDSVVVEDVFESISRPTMWDRD